MGLSVLFGAMLVYDPRTVIIYFIIYPIHKIVFRSLIKIENLLESQRF